MKTFLIGIGILVIVVVAVVLAMASGFSRRIAGIEAELVAARPGPVRDDLPEPVRAFALRGMAGGTPGRAVRLTQAAEMRMRKGADWQRLTARQTISLAESGFAWVAEQRRGPIAVVRVLDSFHRGGGRLEVRLFGAIRLGVYEGPDAAVGEAMRYLAELPWVPDAILANRAITWTETPDGIAARIETAGGPAEVTFSLDAAGDFVGLMARARPATLPDGSIGYLEWRGTLSDYAETGGRRMPRLGEVGYVYPDGYETYFRGRITGYMVVD